MAKAAESAPGEGAWHRQKARFALLSDVVLLIAKTPDLEQLLVSAVNKLKWVIDFERCTLALLDDDGMSYRLRSLFGGRSKTHEENDIPIGQGIAGRTMREQHLRILTCPAGAEWGADLAPAELAEAEGMRALLPVPLHAYGQVFGCITFAAAQEGAFGKEEVKIATEFATHLSLAMERWRVQKALRESEERYALAMEGANEWLWDWDVGSRRIHVSPRLLRFFGMTEESSSLTVEEWQARVHPEDIGRFLDAMRSHFRQLESPYSCELRLRDAGGDYRWMLHRGQGLRDAHGRIYRMAGSLGDVTARKEAETKLRVAKHEAEQALEDLKKAQQSLIHAEKMASLGQLTAGIAHEIKNPLNFVNNFSALSRELLTELQTLLEGPLAGSGAEHREAIAELLDSLDGNLERIREHGMRADRIVKGMLAHSRQGPASAQATDLNALVEESLNLAYHGARAENPDFNVTLNRQLDPAVDEVELYPQDIMRVLLNLIGNAFDATRGRQAQSGESYLPTVEVSTQAGGDHVIVRVRDNGTGIGEGSLGKVFEPFFTTKPTGEGTGLGLSLSYETVVEQHHGRLEVESREGEYTEFKMTLARRLDRG